MADIQLPLRYQGGDASSHALEMRTFGTSLVGIELCLRFGLFIAVENRLPRHKEASPLVIRAAPPAMGCVSLLAIIDAANGYLPIAKELLVNIGSDYCFQFLSYLLNIRGGKKKDAEANLMEMIGLLREAQNTESRRLDIEARRIELQAQNEAGWREAMLQVVDRLAPATQQVVAPVGPSCEVLEIGRPRQGKPTLVDVPMAEVIRGKEPLEVGDLTRVRVRVDQLTKHSRQMKVELPSEPGRFIPAEVRDPAFDQVPNSYTDAIASDDTIEVDAKLTTKPDGTVVKLHIMNFPSAA